MRILQKTKDGGPDSPVDAYFLFEVKSLGSIALLKFNKGSREAFHTHAFNAFTWFLKGDMLEEDISGETKQYQRKLFPKFTSKEKNHRVIAKEDSWCLTVRGPWEKVWTEDTEHHTTVLTHGRVVVEKKEK